MLDFLKNISSTELIVLAIIFIALFGAKTLVSLGKTAGESVREIKKIKKTITEPVSDSKPKQEEVSQD